MDNITKLRMAFMDRHEILMAMLVDDQAQVARAMYQSGGISEDVARLVSCYFHPDFPRKTGKKHDLSWSKWEDMEHELLLLLGWEHALGFLQKAYNIDPASVENELNFKLRIISIKMLASKKFFISKSNFLKILAHDENFQSGISYIDPCKAVSTDWIKYIYSQLISCPPFSRTVIKGDGIDYCAAVDLLCSRYQISTDLCRKILNPDFREKMFLEMGNDLFVRLCQTNKHLGNHPTWLSI